MHRVTIFLSFAAAILLQANVSSARADSMQFGFSKEDITPTEPLRLSGYANRDKPFDGVDQSLWVRTMAIRPSDGQIHILTSVDAIGIPGSLTTEIARRIDKELQVSRERFVICVTHSHAAPHIEAYAPNLFTTPLNLDEEAKTHAYTQRVADAIVASAKRAVADLKPGVLQQATSKVGFAVNRRVLKDGQWTGFGVNADAPVDHSLPMLKITGADGKLRGIVYDYACHCTTLGGDYNRVSGDWAGYASEYLEEKHPGIVALCTIGCGADANPEPRGALNLAEAHGRALSIEINRILGEPATDIDGKLEASFGYAGLPPQRPEITDVQKQLDSDNPQVKRRAQHLMQVYEKMGRLPESYPMPIHTWRFGDDLTMIFLGGEVVVDYANRLRKELDGQNVWVTAYADDVFGYVSSERMRLEGGYEVDSSMVFYNQPGPWDVGTEDVIINRVKHILANPQTEGALSPEQALKSFRLPEGFELELVAAEPLISDPVSFAFGLDGKLWVVEMGDYPRSEDDSSGNITLLTDTNGDGKFDKATPFLKNLGFPTGVLPWRKGVIVSCAPEIFYAEDTNNDGVADKREVLFSGFVESNPQHRINGFVYGLDNWVYVGSGAPSGDIKSAKTGETMNMSGRDIRINPDSGLFDTEAGPTQYGRAMDNWGDWFGSENSVPVFHFVISDRYLRRNEYFPSPDPKIPLLMPNPAPPVYPVSRVIDRFNDLWAANRFTSACSPIVFRDTTLGEDMAQSVFVCEPVHNLVHRSLLIPDGVTFRTERHPSEQNSEFLASTDVWSRPVKLATGPDGALWVADMYRQVIEHPEWIPLDWQARLDLRAGHDKGRIYRVYRKGQRPGALPNLAKLSTADLVKNLNSSNGTVRDMAQQLIVHRGEKSAAASLKKLATSGTTPLARIHALGTLDGLNALDETTITAALNDKDWHVQREAITLSESHLDQQPKLGERLSALVKHPELRVRFQLALSLGQWKNPNAAKALGELLHADLQDFWLRTAVLTSSGPNAEAILQSVLADQQTSEEWSYVVQQLIAAALGNNGDQTVPKILAAIIRPEQEKPEVWQIAALASLIDALARNESSLEQLKSGNHKSVAELVTSADRLFAMARDTAESSDAELNDRTVAVRILGRGLDQQEEDRQRLGALLSPQIPPTLQSAALGALADLKADDVPSIVLANWRGHSPRLHGEILNVLLSRRSWITALLDAIENKEVAPTDLDATTRELLQSRGSKESQARATQLLAAVQSESRQRVLAEHQAVIGMQGNFLRGAEVFMRRCATCHQFRGRGNKVGPDLVALQDKSARSLLISILDPNRAVEWGFHGYVVVTQQGRVLNGLITAESTNSVTLAQSDGQKMVILRADIDQLSGTEKSFMPEGLEKDLSPQDLADVIAFVQSQPSSNPAERGLSVQSARELLASAGLSGVGEVLAADQHKSESTWLGDVDVATCSTGSLAWKTPTFDGKVDPAARVVLRVPVAVGATNGAVPKFQLRIGDGPVLEFDDRMDDGVWVTPDGRIEARYLAVQLQPDATYGVLELAIPGDLVSSGQPLQCEVRAQSGESAAWFGVLSVKE